MNTRTSPSAHTQASTAADTAADRAAAKSSQARPDRSTGPRFAAFTLAALMTFGTLASLHTLSASEAGAGAMARAQAVALTRPA